MKKTKSRIFLAIIMLIAVSALTLPFVTGAATLINDIFADGNSQNQDLANNSLQLFNGRSTTNVRTDAVGSVTFDLNSASSEGFWAYFTDPNEPITLGVGDSLTVSAQFSLQGIGVQAGEDLRFGVFDSKGTRNTTNLTGGMNSSIFTDDTGYAGRLAGTIGNDTPFSLFRRAVVPGATDPLTQAVAGNSGEYAEIFGSSTTGRQPLTDNTLYTYTYKIERLSATQTQLTVTIVGGNVNIQTTGTETSANPNTTFDLFSFRIPGSSFASQITFTQLKVDYSPAAPVITGQPQPMNQTVQVGSNVSYSVTASGSNLSYQWRKDGTAITGNPSANTATLQLTNVQTSDTGNYDVVVSNLGDSVTSDPVSLTVTTGPVDPAPVITAQPQDTVVTIGSTAALSVTATGNNLNYQWYKDGNSIVGANSSTLTIANAQLNDTGDYSVVVSNSGGSITSDTARLTVVSPIMLTAIQPQSGSTNTCVDASLKLTFDQPPLAGTNGIIRVYRADGTLFDAIDLSQDTVPGENVPGNQSSKSIGGASTTFNYYPIIVTDNTATIYLHKQLEYNQTYYLTIEPGVITDTNGAPFAGISDPNAFRFTTRVNPPAQGTDRLTVAADGDGDFCTVQGAIDFVPAGNDQRVTINVQNGVYNEIVYVSSNKPFITVRGEERNATIIQYANNENLNSGTLARSLFGVDASDFVLERITIHNTTTRENAQGNTRQAEAFRGNNDRILLNRVNLISFQDTLLLQSQGPQGGFVNESYIEGAVDFTWGYGAVYFRNCELRDNAPASRSTSYYSQVRNPQGKNGNVYVGCRLTRSADTPDNSAYLSRIDPDDFPYSQVIWIDTLMDTHIRPEGWLFNNPSLPPTPENYPNIKFWEYNSRNINTGQPIDISQRHPLSRQLTAAEADFWRDPANVLGGWVPNFDSDTSDFDGDGRADIAVFRPSDSVWYIDRSNGDFLIAQFGLPDDIIVPADYDGDRQTDIAVYRNGVWYILQSASGQVLFVQWGQSGDVPQPADYDGDGRAELAVFRSGTWYIYNLVTNQINELQFGLPEDKPVAGDYDGDGKAEPAIFRPSTGYWWYLSSLTGNQTALNWGISTDVLVPADYDGDLKTDPAVYRDGVWYILGSSQGITIFQFGLASDLPVPADYDGDGRADAAVYRDGIWYILGSTDGVIITQFGLAGDIPIPHAFVR